MSVDYYSRTLLEILARGDPDKEVMSACLKKETENKEEKKETRTRPDISKYLLDLRKGKELKQEELAKEIGISQRAVSNYERDGTIPDKPTMQKLAVFFGVPYSYLEDLADQWNEKKRIKKQQRKEERIRNGGKR